MPNIVIKQFSKYTEPKLTYENQESNPEKGLRLNPDSGFYEYASNQMGFVVKYDPKTGNLFVITAKTYPGAMDENGYLLTVKGPLPDSISICRRLLSKYYDIGMSLEIADQFYTKVRQQCDDFYINLVTPFEFTKQSKANPNNYNFKVEGREVKIVFNGTGLSMDDVNTLSTKISKIANELYGVLENSKDILKN